ncbi:MAG: hypothetical protein Q9201_002697 [Fulgogasparrea decipioides]
MTDRILPEEKLANAGINEALTGSGSLLSTSESDSWNGRQRPPWASTDDTSSGLPRASARRSGASPIRRQNSSQQTTQSFADPASGNSTYFSVPSASSNQGLPMTSQQHLADQNATTFMPPRAYETTGFQRPSRHNSEDEERVIARASAFPSDDGGFPIPPQRQKSHQSTSGFNSSVASRSGSLPPSRNGGDSLSRFDEDPQNTAYPPVNGSSTTGRPYPSKLSAQALAFSRNPNPCNQRFGDLPSAADMNNMAGDFAMMGIAKENQPPHAGYGLQVGPTFPGQGLPYDLTPHNDLGSTDIAWDADDNTYPGYRDPYAQNNQISLPPPAQYRTPAFNPSYPRSPASNDGRRNQPSPYGSSDGASPYPQQSRAVSRSSLNGNVPAGQALMLDRKLRGLQHEQQGFMSHPSQLHFRQPYSNPYDFQTPNTLRMNLNPYYTVAPMANLLPPVIPRGPAKDQDTSHSTRSACLEEFRSNSKTNKRYELKDVYDHIVEFSGDQHGSRFIQQKLETANSDEKDQAFREILPNAMQLMTDVFGNYVIQKFFEHGNQSQKKILANQMKNHVLALSLQMYGCRVVQKALEHILTDQQASLIGELQKDKQIMRCVKDQNGNHVVQKAIERIPAEHIQFIVNAFTGQVHELSKHAYGCRVIQRMLEHCVEPTRSAILQELHGCAQHLIGDVYGNYVTQHIIEHGREEDRARIISLVTSNIINYSKHKFASNVVETCIKFGNAEQRKKIVDVLTAVNEKGDSNLQYLIRDQYCNYVIRMSMPPYGQATIAHRVLETLLHELKGAELDDLVEIIKPQLAILKRFAYGKQVQAIEALLCSTAPPPQPRPRANASIPPPIDTSASAAPTPPLLTGDGQSPQSSSVPSTNASSVGGGAASSRKSSASNTVEVMTPTST